MARDLLYDAGCSLCAALAREVEALSEGRLRVQSLREPEVQALLDRVRPGWRWEPMLLEEEGKRVRVYAGLGMRMRLIRVLGPARAWRVAQLVARFGGPALGVDWERRNFLRRAIWTFCVLLQIPFPLQKISRWSTSLAEPHCPCIQTYIHWEPYCGNPCSALQRRRHVLQRSCDPCYCGCHSVCCTQWTLVSATCEACDCVCDQVGPCCGCPYGSICCDCCVYSCSY